MAEAEGLEPPSGSPRQFSRLVTYQLAYASGEFGIIVRLASKIKQKLQATWDYCQLAVSLEKMSAQDTGSIRKEYYEYHCYIPTNRLGCHYHHE